ncbi:MAG: hypothetical protein V4561_10140 [Bacteroidota bacterium]
MSHDDDLFRQMAENNPTDKATPKDETFGTASHVRNVYFCPLSGSGIFLNYSYLVSCDHSQDFTVLTLGFTSHSIVLKGVLLKPLYFELMGHLPKMIYAVEVRYNGTFDKKKPIVNEIIIANN